MAYQFTVEVAGLIIASLMGFMFLYYYINCSVRGHNKTRTASMEFQILRKTGNLEVAATSGTAEPDIIIVGAGVLGAALAYSLGKDGRRVRVIERDLSTPDRIAGEALIPGEYLKLIELGLEDCIEEIDAQPLLGYHIYKDGKIAKKKYPLEKYESHVAGRCFHNGRFVQKLRQKAASHPNVSLEQGTVTSLLEENGIVKGVYYKSKSGQQLTAYAPLTIVSDGGFSNLRRSLCNSKVDVASYYVGLILEKCKLPADHPKFAALVLLHDSHLWFYAHSSTGIRCLVDVPSQNVPSVSDGQMAHYLKTVVAPTVPAELYPAFISAVEKRGNIKVMPNRVMAAAPHPTPGVLLMGDALDMRHAITGGGMTVALSDAVIIRNLLRPLLSLHDASTISKYLESFFTLRKPMASTTNTMANALHKVFSGSSDPAMLELQRACFGFLYHESFFSDGLMAILAGISPSPLSLALHVSAMAIYGVGQLLLPFPSPKRIWLSAKMIWVALGIFFPIIKSEGFRQMFFPQTVAAYYRTPPSQKKT